MIIGSYEQAIEDTVPGCMVPCDEQRTKRGTCFHEEKDYSFTETLHPFTLCEGQKRRDKHIQKVYFKGDWETVWYRQVQLCEQRH